MAQTSAPASRTVRQPAPEDPHFLTGAGTDGFLSFAFSYYMNGTRKLYEGISPARQIQRTSQQNQKRPCDPESKAFRFLTGSHGRFRRTDSANYFL